MSSYIVKVQTATETATIDHYQIDEGATPEVETVGGELWVTFTQASQNDEEVTQTLVALYSAGHWVRCWFETDTTADV